MRVGLFVTCLVDLMRPRIGFAAIELLEAAGCEVVVPATQTCCGQPGYNSGDRASAQRARRARSCDEFEDCDYVVVPSGSCARHDQDALPRAASGTIADARGRVERLCARVLRADRLPRQRRAGSSGRPGPLRRHGHLSRLLLRAARDGRQGAAARAARQGARPRPEGDGASREQCCGFGGTFAVKFGDISARDRRPQVPATSRRPAPTPWCSATSAACSTSRAGCAGAATRRPEGAARGRSAGRARGALMHVQSMHFKARAAEALGDERAAGEPAASSARAASRSRRAKVVEAYGAAEFERPARRRRGDPRPRAREARLSASRSSSATPRARGATVHWAETGAEDVRRSCWRSRAATACGRRSSRSRCWARSPGSTTCSQAAGVEVVETDLGEYIIQLAGETPSHIIAPAIHKTQGRGLRPVRGAAPPAAQDRHRRDDARGARDAARRIS